MIFRDCTNKAYTQSFVSIVNEWLTHNDSYASNPQGLQLFVSTVPASLPAMICKLCNNKAYQQCFVSIVPASFTQ